MEIRCVLRSTGSICVLQVSDGETVWSLKRKACRAHLRRKTAAYSTELLLADQTFLDNANNVADVHISNGDTIYLATRTFANILSPTTYTVQGRSLSLALSPCGSRCIIGVSSTPAHIEIWDTSTAVCTKTLRSNDPGLYSVASSPCLKWVYHAGQTGVHRIDVESEDVTTLSRHEAYNVSVTACNRSVVSVTSDKDVFSLNIHSAKTGGLVRSWIPHGGEGFECKLTGSSKYLATSGGYLIRIWRITTGEQVREVQLSEKPLCIDVSPCFKFVLVSCRGNNNVRVLNLGTGETTLILRHCHCVRRVRFTPCGKYVVTSGVGPQVGDSCLKQWAISSGEIMDHWTSLFWNFELSPCSGRVIAPEVAPPGEGRGAAQRLRVESLISVPEEA